ncbi:MAG: UbiA-like polyprenyltransferase [Myxococcota bacterium]|nr:UbiA-like polyprenyltransferase [Myxococcota bacterium]
MNGAIANVAAFGRAIKISHTIFALPFALAAAWLVWQEQAVAWHQWVWIVVAMVGARSSAMGFNRLVDRRIDASNPRTQDRELPSGRLTPRWGWVLTLGSAGMLVLSAGMLHPLALALSPVVIGVLWGYSLTKRFTALCHLWLGMALGLAPLCVWVALTGGIAWAPALMAGAITTWVGGFDILYSLQDRGYDAKVGLHSVPAALGERGALVVSALLHVATLGFLAALPVAVDLGWPYWIGVVLIGGILCWEHTLVRPGDLSKMGKAFFQANSYVSVVFLAAVVAATVG